MRIGYISGGKMKEKWNGYSIGIQSLSVSDTKSKHVNKESGRKEIERVLHIFGLKSIKSIKNPWKKDSFFQGFYPSPSLFLIYFSLIPCLLFFHFFQYLSRISRCLSHVRKRSFEEGRNDSSLSPLLPS